MVIYCTLLRLLQCSPGLVRHTNCLLGTLGSARGAGEEEEEALVEARDRLEAANLFSSSILASRAR